MIEKDITKHWLYSSGTFDGFAKMRCSINFLIVEISKTRILPNWKGARTNGCIRRTGHADRGSRATVKDCRRGKVGKLSKQKKFGLVFEEHLPEWTPLWDIPVKCGSKVALKSGPISDFYTLIKIEDGIATCLNKDKSATMKFLVEELVSVAEFGEPIYPYLKPIDSVCNAPDSDLWHTLIEADNYHALQLLEYLYAGKVDCIYIDAGVIYRLTA